MTQRDLVNMARDNMSCSANPIIEAKAMSDQSCRHCGEIGSCKHGNPCRHRLGTFQNKRGESLCKTCFFNITTNETIEQAETKGE